VTVPFISIVLPVYNQADHIEATLRGYVRALSRVEKTFELLPVVNGVRRDSSLQICQELEREVPEVRTLCIDQGGWGRAVLHGLSEARGELLCYSNSARTTAEDLCLLILYGIAHPDVVIKANRKIRESVVRRFGSLVYNLQCRSYFDLPCWDVNGTPKVFPRRFDRLLNLTSSDDLIDLEFNVACRRAGYPMLEVPILSTIRRGGKSTTNFGSAAKMYRGAWALKRKLGPRAT
jgi:glycosyltransferase involved in cell wall biosynthesis